jgi:hypothetical protein
MKLTILFAATLLATGCASQTDAPRAHEAPTSEPAPALDTATGATGATRAEAATASLQKLARLATPQTTLGFQSVSEAASASLAEPLPMIMVRLDALQAYRAGDDARPLLLEEGSFLYPVTVGGEVRSSVLVHKVNGDWKATQFGRANLAKFAHEGRKQVALARGVAESGVSLVEIPTLSTRMLAHDEKGVPMLTALLDVQGTDLRAGVTRPAADVFAKLQPLAARNDGRSPN